MKITTIAALAATLAFSGLAQADNGRLGGVRRLLGYDDGAPVERELPPPPPRPAPVLPPGPVPTDVFFSYLADIGFDPARNVECKLVEVTAFTATILLFPTNGAPPIAWQGLNGDHDHVIGARIQALHHEGFCPRLVGPVFAPPVAGPGLVPGGQFDPYVNGGY